MISSFKLLVNPCTLTLSQFATSSLGHIAGETRQSGVRLASDGRLYDARCARRRADRDRLQHARHNTAARVATGCPFVHVHGEPTHVVLRCVGSWVRRCQVLRCVSAPEHLSTDEPKHDSYPRCCFTTSTISCAQERISSSRRPSSMTRRSGSVPE